MMNRFMGIVSIAILGFLSEGLEAQEQRITIQNDIIFSTGVDYELMLNIAYPVMKDKARPALVFIHGNWESGTRGQYSEAIKQAAYRGYVAITIDHRPIHTKIDGKPKYPFPAQVCDTKKAIQWLRKNASDYGVDSNRIAAIGFSSGGYLALMAGLVTTKGQPYVQCEDTTVSSSLQAVVNLAGLTDLVDKYYASYPEMMIDLLGGTPEQLPGLYQQASPINLVSNTSPPILTIHGQFDQYVPLKEAQLLDERMKSAGREHTLIIKIGGHNDWWYEEQVWDFLERILKPTL